MAIWLGRAKEPRWNRSQLRLSRADANRVHVLNGEHRVHDES